jgi:tRNA 2-thiouridine synthesizing protein A
MKAMNGAWQRLRRQRRGGFIPMKSDQRLDISGVVIPFSLALCKSTLAQMASGAVLEICLGDNDTLQDLLIIVERSGDNVLAWEKHDECYYLWVRKNPGHQ